ncbi:uncharacterized protein BDW70DRAFT_148431 [Aspergillus foveolatus]|uniref:uncharacterized protein n=1 Tax=Aspergillus foveolatus TaxID=210207 RepID=UPI003CCD0330
MASEANQRCWNKAIELFLEESAKDPGKRRLVHNLPVCKRDDLVTMVQDQLTERMTIGTWHARLHRFIAAMTPYCAAVDAVVQHEPHNTALVWGSIRVIIQVIVAQQETSEEINDAFEFIKYQIDSYHKYLDLFPDELFEVTKLIYTRTFEYILRVRAWLELRPAARFLRAAFSSFRQRLTKIRHSIKEWEQILQKVYEVALETPATVNDQYVFTHFFRNHGDPRLGLASNFALSLISKALGMSDIVENPGAENVIAGITPLMNMPSSKCQLRQLLSILDQLLELLPAVTLLVDALDECCDIQGPGGDLISDFLRRAGTRTDRRVLLFCRSHHYALTGSLRTGYDIIMDEKAIAGDIRAFITAEIEKAGLGSLREMVLQKAAKESQGMFLWARLMIQHVAAGRNLKACRRLIDEFPPALFHVYERSLAQSAESFSADDHDLRYDVLLLLLGAQENLTAAEISTALALSPDTHQLDSELKLIDAETRIARVCWPLIEFTSDRRIQFIHGTVNEFLLSGQYRPHRSQVDHPPFPLSLEDSHQTLARQTLQCLSQELYRTWQHSARLLHKHLLPQEPEAMMETDSTVNESNDFYEYSCRHWQDHLTQLAEPGPIILELLSKFLRRNEFVAWSEAMADLLKLSTPTAQVSVRATLQQWHTAKLKPVLRPSVPLEDYFLMAHQGLRDELEKQARNAVLPYLPLVRLGDFYNVGGETVAEWELGYQFKKEVVAGYETVLGKRSRFTLNARTSLYQEYLWKMRMDEAREGLQDVAKLQLESVGTELPDYYITLYYLGAVEFHLTLFEAARQTLETSANGLKRLLGEVNSKAIQAELFIGYALEAQGHLGSAATLYDDIWHKWTAIAGKTNGIALMTQTAQGSAYRKQGQFDAAKDLLTRSWTERKLLFTIGNNVTVDSGIQLAILWRDLGDNASAIDTIGEVVTSGIFPGDFERACQLDHLRALIDFDSGRYMDGKCRLLRRLGQAGNGDQHHNNRELLWIRITLADVMRSHGEGDDTLILFSDLVTPLSLPDELDDEPEPPQQLEIAEKALRYLKSYNQAAATKLLQNFWILQGGPIADTARMAPPRNGPVGDLGSGI